MPHQIFEIDELVGQVIKELVETSPWTAVSFALTCRSFEKPTLSLLWEQIFSLAHLLRMLPVCIKTEDGCDTTVSDHNLAAYRVQQQFPQALERDLSARGWVRLHQYASWTRDLYLGPGNDYASDALLQLSSNSPGGLLFPWLESLYWNYDAQTLLSFFHPFFSPSSTTCHSPL